MGTRTGIRKNERKRCLDQIAIDRKDNLDNYDYFLNVFDEKNCLNV